MPSERQNVDAIALYSIARCPFEGALLAGSILRLTLTDAPRMPGLVRSGPLVCGSRHCSCKLNNNAGFTGPFEIAR
jgi:hypothetical protein